MPDYSKDVPMIKVMYDTGSHKGEEFWQKPNDVRLEFKKGQKVQAQWAKGKQYWYKAKVIGFNASANKWHVRFWSGDERLLSQEDVREPKAEPEKPKRAQPPREEQRRVQAYKPIPARWPKKKVEPRKVRYGKYVWVRGIACGYAGWVHQVDRDNKIFEMRGGSCPINPAGKGKIPWTSWFRVDQCYVPGEKPIHPSSKSFGIPGWAPRDDSDD